MIPMMAVHLLKIYNKIKDKMTIISKTLQSSNNNNNSNNLSKISKKYQ